MHCLGALLHGCRESAFDPAFASGLDDQHLQTKTMKRGREILDVVLHCGLRRSPSRPSPGGVGKSRFARAWVDTLPRAGDAFTDAWWLGLEDLRSASEVPSLAAVRAGFELKGGDDLWRQLARHVGERRLLVVLDNAEHIAADIAPRLVEWIAACSQLYVVCTSRRRLLVDLEAAMPLDGLPLPDADETDQEVLSHNDAVRLFVQRARKASPHSDLGHHASAVVRLIQMVEGLPLAIELAAAWVRLLPVADIVAELEQSPALRAAPDDANGRDRSLRVGSRRWAITCAWQVCAPPSSARPRRRPTAAAARRLQCVRHRCRGHATRPGRSRDPARRGDRPMVSGLNTPLPRRGPVIRLPRLPWPGSAAES
jgi:hypothetical protein